MHDKCIPIAIITLFTLRIIIVPSFTWLIVIHKGTNSNSRFLKGSYSWVVETTGTGVIAWAM